MLMSALAMLMDTPTFKTTNESTRTLQERHLKQVRELGGCFVIGEGRGSRGNGWWPWWCMLDWQLEFLNVGVVHAAFSRSGAGELHHGQAL